MTRQRKAYLAKRRANFPNAYDRELADPVKAAARKARDVAFRKKTRAWLAKYKIDRGCVDCGFKAHFAALQLDHCGEKSADIADCRSSVKRLLREIEDGKCEVRCANCHSIKTWREKNGMMAEKPPC